MTTVPASPQAAPKADPVHDQIITLRDVLTSVLSLRADGVDKLAISNRWLVYRIGGDLFARRLASPRLLPDPQLLTPVDCDVLGGIRRS